MCERINGYCYSWIIENIDEKCAHILPFLFQALTWTSDSEHFLQNTREQAAQCRTEEEVIDLLDLMEGFIRPGLNKQEVRLKKIGDLSAKLVIEGPRRKAKQLVAKQKEVAVKFDLMDNDLYRLAEKLRERNRLGLPPQVRNFKVQKIP